MSYFRIDTILRVNEKASLEGEAARHMRDARRVKVGEEIEVQDPVPKRYLARVLGVSREGVSILPFAEVPLPDKPKAHLTLVQALISEQNLDLILQKATELGVGHVVLFSASNSPHRIPAERLLHKSARWQKIMEAACEQSGRATPPFLSFGDIIDDALDFVHGPLYLLQQHAPPLRPTEEDLSGLIVGPEGGLTEKEVACALSRGAIPASVGLYTLRAETAAIAGVARVLS